MGGDPQRPYGVPIPDKLGESAHQYEVQGTVIPPPMSVPVGNTQHAPQLGRVPPPFNPEVLQPVYHQQYGQQAQVVQPPPQDVVDQARSRATKRVSFVLQAAILLLFNTGVFVAWFFRPTLLDLPICYFIPPMITTTALWYCCFPQRSFFTSFLPYLYLNVALLLAFLFTGGLGSLTPHGGSISFSWWVWVFPLVFTWTSLSLLGRHSKKMPKSVKDLLFVTIVFVPITSVMLYLGWHTAGMFLGVAFLLCLLAPMYSAFKSCLVERETQSIIRRDQSAYGQMAP